MKFCPKCQRTYGDETLKFCRVDGAKLTDAPSSLTDGPSSSPEHPTRILPPRPHDSEEAVTKEFDSEAGGGGTSGEAKRRRKRTARNKTIDSLAVLPLAGTGGDPEIEYLGDGITESLINNLSQIPKLRVMARATVFRYKGSELDPQEVGRELSVRAVLMGRVLYRQERLSIRVELIDAADGSHLWGEHYNRGLEDIFSIEEEIAAEIAEKLRLRLSGGVKDRLVKRFTEDAEAYQLLLKGRYSFYKQTEEGFRKARQYFEQAIAREPNYALAHAYLARTYNSQLYFGYLPQEEALPKISAALEKALELDPTLSEAHLTLAEKKFHYDWDWAAAEREFKRAIELSPNNAEAHLLYAFYLADMERPDEAVGEAKRAQDLDPLSLFTQMAVGFIFSIAGRPDEALEQGRRLLEMEPNFFGAHWLLGVAYSLKGVHEKALAEIQRALELGGGPLTLSFLGFLYGLSGRRGEALRIVEELSEARKRRHVPASDIAIVYAGLGMRDQALEWLEKAYQERSGAMTSLKVNRALDPLRSDPRFDALLDRVGLRR
jgi:serine/threonine-protein kinase